MSNEAQWPPSPCEKVIDEEGGICADAATYRPGLYAYLCDQHAEEVREGMERAFGIEEETKP